MFRNVFRFSGFYDLAFQLSVYLLMFLYTFSKSRVALFRRESGMLLSILIVILLGRRWFTNTYRIIRSGWFVPLLIISLSVPLRALSVILVNSTEISGHINDLGLQVMFCLFFVLIIGESQSVQNLAEKSASVFCIFALIALTSAVQLFIFGETLLGPFAIQRDFMSTQLDGWFPSPNYLVDVLGIGFLSANFLRFSNDTLSTKGICFLLFLGCIATGSRGGILAMLLALCTQYGIISARNFTWNFLKVNGQTFRYMVVSLLIVTGLSTIIMKSGLAGDIESMMNNYFRLGSIATGAGRTLIWTKGLDKLEKSDFAVLLIGHGSDSFQQETGIALHNSYFQILYDNGILLMLFLGFFFLVYSTIFILSSSRSKSTIPTVSASIFVFVFIRGFFQNSHFFQASYGWLILTWFFFLMNCKGHGTISKIFNVGRTRESISECSLDPKQLGTTYPSRTL